MNIGIDLGGSHIAVGIIEEGIIVRKKELDITEENKNNIMCFIEDTIIDFIQKLKEEESLNPEIYPLIEKIGIAVPGAVKDNKIVKCVNLGIEELDLAEKLKKRIEKFQHQDVDIKLNNDTKCAAIAEKKYGTMKKYGEALFLTLGTGIGGAIIQNGEVYLNKNISGFEFGHTIIDINSDRVCNCGKKGCFELYASMKSFKNSLIEKLNLNEFTTGEQLYELLKYNRALKVNESEIDEVIDEYVKYLAIGISNFINIFEPEAICIGGSFVYFEEFLIERLKKYIISNNLLFNKRDDIIIEPATLRNDAGMIGAVLL